MDLIPGSEQQEIINATARFLDEQLPLARLRDSSGVVPDEAVWRQMAELGWFGLGLEECLGGIGYTLAEEALVMKEVGRRLGPLSIMATLLAVHLTAASGRRDLTEALVKGSVRAGLANPVGQPSRDNGLLAGDFQLLDATAAPYALYIDCDYAALLDVAALERDDCPCIDASITLNTASLAGIVPLVSLSGAPAQALFQRALVMAAAQQAGQAQACCEMAVEYAKTRMQFGKPIGSFQAVKHRCANMAVRSEAAGSLAIYAAVAFMADKNDAALAAVSAKKIAGNAARGNAADNVQIHGGIGFTEEYDAHFYVKRSHVLENLFGPLSVNRQRVLDI